MSCSYTDAVDEIWTMFNTRWLAKTTALVGYVPEVYYQGMEKAAKPLTNKYYVTAKILPAGEKTITFRNNLDGLQNQRYNNYGVLKFVIFAPLSDSQNALRARQLGIVIRDSYSGKESPSGVSFFNVVIKEDLPPTESFNKISVYSDYNYDDVRSST